MHALALKNRGVLFLKDRIRNLYLGRHVMGTKLFARKGRIYCHLILLLSPTPVPPSLCSHRYMEEESFQKKEKIMIHLSQTRELLGQARLPKSHR